MSTKGLFLSYHAMDRLRERHDKHLLAYNDRTEFIRSCHELFARAEETRRFVNDTAFMVNIQERYGYEKIYSFRQYRNVLFVIVDETCVTVLDTETPDFKVSRQFKPGTAAPIKRKLKPGAPGRRATQIKQSKIRIEDEKFHEREERHARFDD